MDDQSEEVDERPWEQSTVVRRDCEPSRGRFLRHLVIVALGCSLSTYFCFATGLLGLPLGIAVWLMTKRDLAKMQAGLMDQDGKKETIEAQHDAVSCILLVGIPSLLLGLCLGCSSLSAFFSL